MGAALNPHLDDYDAPEFDPVEFVMLYEVGELDEEDVIDGFQHLVKSGMIWSLQGSYQRTAHPRV